ncbi:MAG: Ig-like domain-containing protein [Acidobacteria bacterium]|nr:Ig-like domain-containing protein [Acidobacteriota bacterium]
MPSIPTFARRVLPLLLLLSAAVCAQTPKNAKTVKLSPETAQAEVGQQLKFSVAATDADGNPTEAKAAFWVALPGDSAAADDSGNVNFFAPGEVKVIAIINGRPAIARVSVKPARVTKIELDKLSAPLIVGGSYKLNAKVIGANGDPRSDVALAWASENPAVAVVDAAGIVTGIAPGKAKLSAKADGATGELLVEVVKSTVRNLALEPRTATARTGDVVRFSATAKDANGGAIKNAVVRWSVSGDGATIDADGGFVAARPGTYAISAAVGDQTTTASIVVAPRNVERSLELVGRVRLKDMQVSEQWMFGNYLYISTVWDQIQVYDISDPKSPKLTETVKVDARVVNDVSLTPDGKIGVVTREGASSRKNGIVFLDTTDLAHPKVLSEYTATVTGGVHSAYIDGQYVYLTDDATGSMRVISFKDVKNPREVARWEVPAKAKAVQNAATGEAFSEGRYLHDVQVKDGLAYLAYWRDGLIILDVGAGIKGGSPENPKLVSQLRFNHHELYGDGWLAGTHEVYRYKNYVFVGDEVFPEQFNIYDKARIAARGVLHVVDVSDITNPRKVAEYAVPEGGAHNVWVKDDVLVMGYYGGGGRVLDVSGELRGDLYQQGREIARLWTGDPQGFRPNIPFTWGARQFGEYIFFNDVNSGIWIMKLGQPKQKGSTTAPGE